MATEIKNLRVVLATVALCCLFSSPVIFPALCSAETPRYHAEYACQGEVLRISCDRGRVIHLIRANYGRFSIQKCNSEGNTTWATDCMSHRSVRVLHSRCSNRQKCDVFANSTLFGDPCPETNKYLEAHYQCVPAVEKPRSPDIRGGTGISNPSPIDDFPAEEESTKPSSSSSSNSNSADVIAAVEKSTPAPSLPEGATSEFQPGVPSDALEVQQDPETTPRTEVGRQLLGGDDLPGSSVPVAEDQLGARSSQLPLRFSNRSSGVRSGNGESLLSGSDSPCAPQKARNLVWNWTAAGETAVQGCPAGSAPGVARWRCLGPHWETPQPDLSECRSLWLGSIQTRMESGHSLDTILNEVRGVTSSKSLFGGDVRATAGLLQQTARRLIGRDVKEVSETIARVMGVGSDLIGPEQAAAWDDLPPVDRSQAATDLLLALEDNAFVLADGLSEDRTVLLAQMNILMSAQKLKPDGFPVVSFPTEDESRVWNLDDGTSIYIPGKALVHNSKSSGGGVPGSNAAKVVFFLMNNLDRALAPVDDHRRSANTVVGSRVISASLGGGRHVQLAYPVTIVFRNLRQENVSGHSCVFWDYTTSSWSNEGCRVVGKNKTYTQCECSHLTHFAVLVNLETPTTRSEPSELLAWLTCAALSVSIACFIASLIISSVWKTCQGEKWVIYRNFLVCIMTGELVFVLGIHQTENAIACGIIAGLLHYFFLAAFVWSFLQEFDLYMNLVEVTGLEAKRRVRWYAAVAYGVPLLIVGISAVVDPSNYGGQDYCWVGFGNFSLFSFGGPVLVILIATLVVFAMSVLLSSRRNTQSNPRSDFDIADLLKTTKKWIACASSMTVMLALTWTLGFITLASDFTAVAVCFIVFNFLFGVFTVLATTILADKASMSFGRKFPFCYFCFMLKSSGSGGASEEPSQNSNVTNLTALNQRNENSRQKRGDGGIIDCIGNLAEGGEGAEMNYYITTLKNYSATCSRCPHSYCNVPDPPPFTPRGAVPPRPNLMASSGSVSAAYRAQSPGNHTYMELELNADGSTIYAEIDHDNHKHQLSDCSDLSQQSCRSYNDSRPLLPPSRSHGASFGGQHQPPNIPSIPEDRPLETVFVQTAFHAKSASGSSFHRNQIPRRPQSSISGMPDPSPANYRLNNLNQSPSGSANPSSSGHHSATPSSISSTSVIDNMISNQHASQGSDISNNPMGAGARIPLHNSILVATMNDQRPVTIL